MRERTVRAGGDELIEAQGVAETGADEEAGVKEQRIGSDDVQTGHAVTEPAGKFIAHDGLGRANDGQVSHVFRRNSRLFG